MKKFVINTILFFAIIAIIDLLFGYGLDYMYSHAKGGDAREMNDVCRDGQYDVIVMGSSRAQHHYVPEIIADSLSLSCYNTGKDGNGIVLMYGIYQMIKERYKPSFIVYDIAKGFDIYENELDQNDTRYVSLLKPYNKVLYVDEIFKSFSWQEWVKTWSSLYRFNSKTFSVATSFLFKVPYHNDGYVPLTGVMDYEPAVTEPKDSGVQDSLKINYFERFIRSTQTDGIPLICVISPTYGAASSERYLPIKKLCMRYGIPCFDYYTDGAFLGKKVLFKDATHLNDYGARLFTSLFVTDLKKQNLIINRKK